MPRGRDPRRGDGHGTDPDRPGEGQREGQDPGNRPRPQRALAGRENIAEAGLQGRIRCLRGDVKGLTPTLGGRQFEAVISNTIIHHIPEPAPAVEAMKGRVAPGGTLMVRDLAGPNSREEVDRLVQIYAGGETPEARGLFEDSLHAALTLAEIREIIEALGLPAACAIIMTSDRHWTLTWRRPASCPTGTLKPLLD